MSIRTDADILVLRVLDDGESSFDFFSPTENIANYSSAALPIAPGLGLPFTGRVIARHRGRLQKRRKLGWTIIEMSVSLRGIKILGYKNRAKAITGVRAELSFRE